MMKANCAPSSFRTPPSRKDAAKLHRPDPRAERGTLIAATALVHGLIVIMPIVVDFAATGVTLVNSWDD
jgi:predicted nucleic acid-binding protein